ncbi:MAG: DUF4360 domain-containing protein [Proteobacteria bacterium]|nr:DUF4360 domain-containing protein [Pseudomonadota bacterium]
MIKALSVFFVAIGLSLSPLVLAEADVPNSFRIQSIRSNGTEERKNCRLLFDTEQDAAWEYAILAVNFRGYAALEAGVRGQQNLRIGPPSAENQAKLILSGPYDDDYINTQEMGLGNLKWSGCQSNKVKDFVIAASLLLVADRPEARGLFTVDTFDGEIRQEYELLWRKCGDSSKRFLSTCRLEAYNPRKGTHRSVLSKAQAKNDSMALQKAKKKMTQKCDKLNARGLSCDASLAVCQAGQF